MNVTDLLKYMFRPGLTALLVLFSCHISYAQAKYLYYIGGGESVSQNSRRTNFDYSFSHIKNLENEDWEARYLFAGEQKNSKKLRLELGDRSQALTQENLPPFLQEIESKLAGGFLNHGQLLIYLDTHGVMDNGKYLISTINGNVDILPSLLRIKSLAHQNKVKLGIIGATCFSGQLMALEDENTCVLTTAPSDTVGLMMNNNVIAYLLGQHSTQNLEDLHLKSRKFKDIDLGQPLISTPAGKKAYDLLKELRTAVLVAGKKSGPEIHGLDQQGVEKTLENISTFLKTANQKENPLISKQYLSRLKALDQRLKALLGQHRESLVATLSNTCQSLNPNLQENPPCDLSRKEISERNTSASQEQGVVIKPVELPPSPDEKTELSLPEPGTSLQLLNQLVQTSTEIGSIERELYDLLYRKFSQEARSKNICQNFETK